MKSNHRTLVFIFYTVIYVITICAKTERDPIEKLISRNKNNNDLVSRIEKFREKEYGKSLNTGNKAETDLIRAAKEYIGIPYCWGGTSNSCLDCSGLLFAAFRDIGVQCPHSSQELARYGTIILDSTELLPGCLLFFTNTYTSNDLLITHSAIYLGEGKFIHTSSQKGVEIKRLGSDYWKEKFLFATILF